MTMSITDSQSIKVFFDLKPTSQTGLVTNTKLHN